MADLRISQLPVLTGALLDPADPLAIADLSSSETKKVTAKDLVESAVAFIADGSIPSSKLSAITVSPGAIGTTELADGAVTGPKLADNSTTVIAAALPGVGDYIGQLAVNTTDGHIYIWDGGAWGSYTSNSGVNVIQGGSNGSVTTTAVATGDTTLVTAGINDSTGPAQFLAGPTAVGGQVVLRGLIGDDLPKATSTSVGAISVSAGSGITINGGASGLGAAIEIDNNVTASAADFHVVRYDAHGLVTSGRLIAGTDLPIATAGGVGAIALGTEFVVTPGDTLSHANHIAPGTGVKVTYDGRGHITASSGLLPIDIPQLDASIINSGTFSAALIADRSVSQAKLSDYSIAYIQEQVPLAQGGDHHIGMIWFQESSGTLSMWNGNSWMAAADGALYNRNLRYAGTFDPNTGFVTGVTQYGAAEGAVIGSVVPPSTDDNAGLYYAVDRDSTGTLPVAPAYTPLSNPITAGDWILSHGAAGGYHHVDMTAGSGGGGGSSKLGGLLDVTLTTPQPGQTLAFGSSGQWVNIPSPAGIATTPPIGPTLGQTWTDTSTTPPTLKVWDGTKWVAVGAAPKYATELAEGTVQLATDAVVKAGSNKPTGEGLAVTAFHLKANYYQKNTYIQNLPDLP